jgi:hypothetical protein
MQTLLQDLCCNDLEMITIVVKLIEDTFEILTLAEVIEIQGKTVILEALKRDGGSVNVIRFRFQLGKRRICD